MLSCFKSKVPAVENTSDTGALEKDAANLQIGKAAKSGSAATTPKASAMAAEQSQTQQQGSELSARATDYLVPDPSSQPSASASAAAAAAAAGDSNSRGAVSSNVTSSRSATSSCGLADSQRSHESGGGGSAFVSAPSTSFAGGDKAGQDVERPGPSMTKALAGARQDFPLTPPEELLCDISSLTYVGCGFFAKVFKGMWHSSKVAVKFMVTSPESLKQMSRGRWSELMCKELSHPNLVQTFVTRCAEIDGAFLASLNLPQPQQPQPQQPGQTPPPQPQQPPPPQAGAGPSNQAGGESNSNAFVSGDGFGDPKGFTRQAAARCYTLRDIIQLLGAQEGSYVAVIVMNFVDGGPLLPALAQGIFLPRGDPAGDRHRYRALLRTASDIAKGLEYIHSKDLVHGDLKPPNVLLKSSRQDRRGFIAQICDFGLSRLVEGSQDLKMTAPTGSFAYMAPEVLASSTSKATDIYALGILLWEMYFGERPYKGMTVPEVLMGVSSGTLRPVWRAMPYGADHPELRALYLRCVDQNPKARPIAKEVVEELARIEEGVRRALPARAAH